MTSAAEANTMAAYIVVESQVSNPEVFKGYMNAAPEVVKAFGGEYLVRGGRSEVLEGDWNPKRLTVLRYPTFEQAKAMYDSPGYTAARQLRHGATAMFNMVLVEGVDGAV
jgi:uncharacterized protein (DUF1330 family)